MSCFEHEIICYLWQGTAVPVGAGHGRRWVHPGLHRPSHMKLSNPFRFHWSHWKVLTTILDWTLTIQSTLFPVLMLLWQPQKSASLSLHLMNSRGKVMLAKDFQMLLFAAKPPFPVPKACILSFVPLCLQPGQDALLSCALGLFSLSCIPTVRIIGLAYHRQQEDGMRSKGLWTEGS